LAVQALFKLIGIPWPVAVMYRYSKDANGLFPVSPAYFNFWIQGSEREGVDGIRPEITEATRRVTAATGSRMPCQITLTIMTYRAGIDIATLPAAYNTANDGIHLSANCLTADKIRVLHFLRTDKIDRAQLQPYLIDNLLARSLTNPANVALQNLAREYRESLK
jgi:hypothetical protein